MTCFLLIGTKLLKPVMPESCEFQSFTFISQQRCNLLFNHGLFRYSMFSAPGDIIGNFTTFEG